MGESPAAEKKKGKKGWFLHLMWYIKGSLKCPFPNIYSLCNGK